MIRGTFKRNQADHIVSFEVSGHADTGPHGSDIVCAAVSALTFSTVNGVAALAGFTPILSIDNDNEGYLYCEMITEITAEQSQTAQILLENLLLALTDIQLEYPEVIELITRKKK